ncbi:hypothetical protein COOONC_20221 [Cooperia oncophora]
MVKYWKLIDKEEKTRSLKGEEICISEQVRKEMSYYRTTRRGWIRGGNYYSALLENSNAVLLFMRDFFSSSWDRIPRMFTTTKTTNKSIEEQAASEIWIGLLKVKCSEK